MPDQLLTHSLAFRRGFSERSKSSSQLFDLSHMMHNDANVRAKFIVAKLTGNVVLVSIMLQQHAQQNQYLFLKN